MKRITLLFLLPLAISSLQCKTCKNRKNEKSKTQTEQSDQKSTTETKNNVKQYRFTVSFISKGSGIDYQLLKKFDEFITAFEAKNNVKILIDKAPWGREGEMDYCFNLDSLNKDITAHFIQDSKELLKASDRINIGENTHCRGTVKTP